MLLARPPSARPPDGLLARRLSSARVRQATGIRKSIGKGMHGSRFAGLPTWTVLPTANAMVGGHRGTRRDRGGSRRRCCCLPGSHSCGAHVLISNPAHSAASAPRPISVMVIRATVIRRVPARFAPCRPAPSHKKSREDHKEGYPVIVWSADAFQTACYRRKRVRFDLSSLLRLRVWLA
jgi:hypothetical protein